ncbi:hypothetical protein WR25_20933 [Diploscapter pachys]|uniref:Uncharacterized protein n=1 Tax=Diploscapter pachys TaxID=2018661 RepID=A0A2A2KAM7_9BILA|nr:hypothetical protein WR25_20933 [Diploscapter pachys]
MDEIPWGDLMVEEFQINEAGAQCNISTIPKTTRSTDTCKDDRDCIEIGRTIASLKFDPLIETQSEVMCYVGGRGDQILKCVYESASRIKKVLGERASRTPFADVTRFVSAVTGMLIYEKIGKLHFAGVSQTTVRHVCKVKESRKRQIETKRDGRRKSKRARKSADNDDDYMPSDEKEEFGSEDEQPRPKQEEDSDQIPPIEQNLAGILELAEQQITEGDQEG